MTQNPVVIVEGARTPWAEYVGTPGFGLFKDLSSVDLATAASKAALAKSKVDASRIGHVVFGNAMQTGVDAIYGARHVALQAGCRVETPAVTINRLCGSGIEAVHMGARFLNLGETEYVLAGGMESMSQAPYIVRGLRGSAPRFGSNLTLVDALFDGLKDTYCDMYMAQTAEKSARQYGITREQQDAYALRSQQEAARAMKAGLFKGEIVPVPVRKGRETVSVEVDDHPKPDTTLEKLAALTPAFGTDGMVTGGNASGIVDGAAAVVLTTESRAKQDGLKPIGRVRECVAVGVPPDTMGIGPAPAIREVLKRAALKLEQIDLFEINEAFSGQYLAVEKELGLDRARANVNGGSIALGHPLGATGTRLILTLLYELRRRGKKLGIASACIGGGQGIAMIVEAV